MATPGGPALVRLGGGQLLVRGSAVLDLVRLAELGARVARQRDGIEPPARIRALLEALTAEAAELPLMSADGHADVRREADRAASAALELIDVAEVANMLTLSIRQARRLMPDLGGRKVGRSWRIDRATAAAYALEADRG